MTEAEVLADRHAGSAEGTDEHVVDELAGRALGELGVERDHDQLAHAERGEQLGLARERRQQPGRVLRRDNGHRVRIERERDREALDACAAPGAALTSVS